jgi:hypothetical protein
MHPEALIADVVPCLEFLDSIGLTGSGEKRRQPVVMLDDLV